MTPYQVMFTPAPTAATTTAASRRLYGAGTFFDGGFSWIFTANLSTTVAVAVLVSVCTSSASLFECEVN